VVLIDSDIKIDVQATAHTLSKKAAAILMIIMIVEFMFSLFNA
jgi:hypothetical protein